MRTPARGSPWRVIPQLIAVLLVAGLAGAMAVQPTRQLLAQRQRIDDMRADLRAVTRSNKQLERHIVLLHDPDYLEQEARKAGLVRPGETLYSVVPPARGGHHHHLPRARAAEPAAPGFMERFLHFVGLL